MKYEEAQEKFLKNPYWKGVFENAPEKCKEYYREHFAYSLDAVDKTEHEQKVIDLYKTFTDGDWEYIISHAQNKMGKWGLEQARNKYQPKKA